MDVIPITRERVDDATAFLERRTETALFLLANLAAFGPAAGAEPYSGDFKGLVDTAGRLVGVFCLTRSGVLLVDTHGRPDVGGVVFEACRSTGICVQAVIGERNAADAIWPLVKTQPGFAVTWESPEDLYRLPIGSGDACVTRDRRVRALTSSDFTSWNPINLAYLAEVGMSLAGSTAERERAFNDQTALGRWWGLVDDGELVTTATINAAYEGVAQVGAVYTVPARRGEGLARATMARLIEEAPGIHRLRQLVLFTGETNAAAGRLYRSLGFAVVGKYGVYFGSGGQGREDTP